MAAVKIIRLRLVLLVVLAGSPHGADASSAPAPLLQSPASGAVNIDPDPTLTWRWVDDLMSNGSFESGMSPGWYVGGSNPTIWQVFTAGYRWAGATMPTASPATGRLIQDLYIPADAVSATLQWSERIFDLYPTLPIGRLRVMLFQGGTLLTTLEDAIGNEPIFVSHNWVTRTNNLLAYAGQSFQLVIQADSYSPQAATMWWADVDGFSFACENASATPEFQVLLGKSSVLRDTNQIGDTTALSLVAPPLDSLTRYYWRVGAVRDGVTNFSTTRYFNTGQRVLPAVTVVGVTGTGVQLSFPTHEGRNYVIEQRDRFDQASGWYDALWAGPGTGAPMEAEVPLPLNGTAFWRLRVSP
jgi:hypothetical protein